MTHSQRRVTIYDVASLAGVSIGTVSRTLNSPSKVTEGTRTRVLDAVRELNFVPKEVAGLRARRGNGRIGVVAPFSTHASFGERLNGVLTASADSGVDVVVFDVESAEKSASVLESLPIRRSLDGLIVMSIPFGERALAAIRQAGFPVVLVDIRQHALPTVMTDDERGGRLVGRALAGRGARHLAFVGHRQESAQIELAGGRRLRGFVTAVEAAGLSLPEDRIVLAENDFESTFAAATELLSRADRPDGVFAYSDEHAAAVLKAANHLGLRVPDDVALIGYDDSTLANALDLTSVNQPLRQTGEWAVNALLGAIADTTAVIPSLTLPVTLTRRGSA